MLTDLRHWLVLVLVATQTACGSLYVAQAAKGQFQVLAARRSIDRVVADPRTPADLAERLERVRAARAFAVRELGLPDNKSYKQFAQLNRRYVVWSVVAAPEFAVAPKEWCFPFVGCVAYRGYFAEAAARKFAATLERQGYDVIVNGIAAYSTLGKFADPILDTMMIYGDDELAAMVFHELSHQILYVANDTAFNEAFAVTVEQEGLARWLAAQGRPTDVERFRARREFQADVAQIVARYRTELEAWYATDAAPAEKRARKQELFAALVGDIDKLEQATGIRSGLKAELAQGANNARLASLATYYDCVPGFERLLVAEQNDLARFYRAARELADRPRAQRRAALCSSGG
jgi:predicted aminopeptidase